MYEIFFMIFRILNYIANKRVKLSKRINENMRKRASAFRKNQLEVKLAKKLLFGEVVEVDTDDYQRTVKNEDECAGEEN